MNREIKFRVWDLNKKCFVVYPRCNKSVPCNWNMNSIFEDEDVVFQQFAGLKDKNGKEIYEGDIVKARVSEEEKLLRKIFEEEDKEYTNGIIEFILYSWNVCQTGVGRSPLSEFVCCNDHPTKLEIIGNIFENPKLLKQNVKSL